MDAATLGRLIDRHAAALTLYARQWAAAPEDAVQEALLALATLPRSPVDPVAYLYVSTRNAAISQRRSDTRRQKRERAAVATRPMWFTPREGDALDAAAAQDALTKLPDTEREVIVARLWGGLTFEQAAGVQGVNVGTACRRYHAGLARLRELLRSPCPTNP